MLAAVHPVSKSSSEQEALAHLPVVCASAILARNLHIQELSDAGLRVFLCLRRHEHTLSGHKQSMASLLRATTRLAPGENPHASFAGVHRGILLDEVYAQVIASFEPGSAKGEGRPGQCFASQHLHIPPANKTRGHICPASLADEMIYPTV